MELSVGLGAARVVGKRAPGNDRVANRAPQKKAARPSQRAFRISLNWLVFSVVLVALIHYGWINRNERHWTPEEGIGYWLGIIGSVMMALLLIYPLRKRFRALAFLGKIPTMFRLHMAFGVLGPALILLHCNFKSASLNASVALYSMLIVVFSGFIGRFIYGHVHSTLTGHRKAASAFFEDNQFGAGLVGQSNPYRLSARSLERITTITKTALVRKNGLIGAIGHASLVRWQTRQLARSLQREVRTVHAHLCQTNAAPRRQLNTARKAFESEISRYLTAVRNAAGLAAYERWFALWHFLHLPLLLMLVIAVIVHIIAVHLY